MKPAKPIRIDFAPPSIGRVLFRIRPRTWVIGGIGLLLCAGSAYTAGTLLNRSASAQTELRQLRAKQAQRTARKPEPKKIVIEESQAAAVNSAVAQLNLPWRDVWNAIEAATPATVALLSIEPDAKKHLVRGLAEAKTSDAMIGYIEQLKQQPFFDAVVLTKHEVNEQDPNKPLRFQFEAHWTEAGQ